MLSKETRQENYVKRNSVVRSRNNCRRGKAVRITNSEFISVALVIQHAKPMHRTVLSCDLSGSTIFFSHYLINAMILEKKKY